MKLRTQVAVATLLLVTILVIPWGVSLRWDDTTGLLISIAAIIIWVVIWVFRANKQLKNAKHRK